MKGISAIKDMTVVASATAARLKQIAERAWRILTSSPADGFILPSKKLCLCIDRGSITAAYGVRFLSRIKIKGIKSYPAEEGRYPQPGFVASTAALAATELGAIGADVILCIPKAWLVFKTADFPITVKESLSDAVSYELDRLTPLSSEDAFYDFNVLKEGAGRLTISIAVARSDLINSYLNAIKDKGINVSAVTVSLSGMGALYRYVGKGTNSVFVGMDNNGYEGALFLDGLMTGIFVGDFKTEDGISKVETIAAEIRCLLDADSNKSRSANIMLLLKDKNSAVKEMLGQRLGLSTFMIEESNVKLGFKSEQKDIPYYAVGGLLELLWPKAKGMDLFTKGRRDKPKTPIAFSMVLLLAAVMALILFMVAPLQIMGKKLSVVDLQIKTKKEEVKKAEAVKKEVDTLSGEIVAINSLKSGRPMTIDILKELTAVLPKTAWLTRVRITEATVEIEGFADSATALLPKLESSKYFDKVEFASPTFRDVRMNADRFIIKMGIEDSNQNKGALSDEKG